MEIVRLAPDDWATFRAIRLAALTDAPSAFGSTIERERTLVEADWRGKLAGRAQWIARDASGVLGTAGGYRDGAWLALISMWVEPRARCRGVGGALVTQVVAHARERGCSAVKLRVTEGNVAAERLYARFGFVRNGVVEPAGARVEVEMELAL